MLVIGGGIAGIQAALDMANAGLEVVLVEKQATIGGHMLQLSETFPTLDCSQCILSPKMVEVSAPQDHADGTARSRSISGFVGNFKVKIAAEAAVRRSRAVQDLRRLRAVCPVVCPTNTISA